MSLCYPTFPFSARLPCLSAPSHPFFSGSFVIPTLDCQLNSLRPSRCGIVAQPPPYPYSPRCNAQCATRPYLPHATHVWPGLIIISHLICKRHRAALACPNRLVHQVFCRGLTWETMHIYLRSILSCSKDLTSRRASNIAPTCNVFPHNHALPITSDCSNGPKLNC